MIKVLIVEDDVMLSEIYQKKFSAGGFEVIGAMTGTIAIEKSKSEKPDLVMLDLVLPEEDGFDVLKKIKEDEETKDMKVIIFSNLSQEEDKQKAESLGAIGFIAKSDFTPQQVVDQVRKILSLPAQEGNDPGLAVKADLSVPKRPQKFSPKKGAKNILIIEDEEVFIEVFGTKLEEAGFRIDSARNGVWGIKKVEEFKYDLIVLDILMPMVDGFEVIEKIRQNSLNRETPVLVMSNSIEDEQIQKILKSGADEFLIKTKITPSELVEKVKKMLG